MSREIINLGNEVICDRCNRDSHESGGLSFSGYAYCPDCAVGILKRIKEHNEEQYIDAVCPEGKSFHDWVVEDLRGGKPGTIEIVSGKDLDDEFKKKGLGWIKKSL